MTVETITEDAYRGRVDDLAEIAVEMAREECPDSAERQREALVEIVYDVLDGERWFTHHQYGPAAHGCIVENQMHETHLDPGLYEADGPEMAIQRLAYEVTRHDVLAGAEDLL